MVFEDFKIYEGMTLGSVREMPVTLAPGYVINVFINQSYKLTQYLVNYKKFQTVFAEIGGMISLVITIAIIFL
jgi:hypothetical protein